MSTIFLALAATLALTQYAPKIHSPHDTLAECRVAAEELNKDPALQTPEMKELGAKYVCMKIV
jgi:hypothetical protein